MSRVWIPEKKRIESMLAEVLDALLKADKVKYVEQYIDDELSGIQCHVANRAAVERGEIKCY
jgi:hypothetical protein